MQTRNSLPFGGTTEATMTRLSGSGAAVPLPVSLVQAAGGKTAELLSPSPVPLDSAVRLDINGGLILAEVQGCRPEGVGYRLTLSIDQVIPSLSELANLMQALMMDGSRARANARLH